MYSHNLSTTNISGGGSKSLHFSEVQNEVNIIMYLVHIVEGQI